MFPFAEILGQDHVTQNSSFIKAHKSPVLNLKHSDQWWQYHYQHNRPFPPVPFYASLTFTCYHPPPEEVYRAPFQTKNGFIKNLELLQQAPDVAIFT